MEDLLNMYDDVYYKKTPCEICTDEDCGLRGKRITAFDKKNKCKNFTDKPIEKPTSEKSGGVSY